MAQQPEKAAAQQDERTTLVVRPRNAIEGVKDASVRLDLVEEDGVNLFLSRGPVGQVRGRIHKDEDGNPDGRIDLTYKKKDGSEVNTGVLFVNVNGESGAKFLGGYVGQLSVNPNSQNADRPWVNIVPGQEGLERTAVNAQIFGEMAEAIFEALPVYKAKSAPAAEAEAEEAPAPKKPKL